MTKNKKSCVPLILDTHVQKRGEIMLPCRYYAINTGKEGFKCEFEEQEHSLFLCYCSNKDFVELNSYCNKYCPRFSDCVKLADETFRKFREANVVVNNFGDGRVELVVYNKPFRVPEQVINDKVDRRRCFRLVNMDFLVPLKKDATIAKLHKTVYRAGKRAFDTFTGYARSNKWDYFFTFTFSPQIVPDRANLFVIRELWRKFQLKLKYFDSGCRILGAPEPHKDGARHYHTLMCFSNDLPIVDYGDLSKLPQRTCEGGANKGKTGFCTFTKDGNFTYLPKTDYKLFLVPYYSYGELQKSKLGDTLFCLNIYPFGINSCAIMPGDDTNQAKVARYVSAYMMKDGNSQYNQKRFTRTQNVAGKVKVTLRLKDDDLQELINGAKLQEYKSTDKLTVFRNFDLSSDTALVPLSERLKR